MLDKRVEIIDDDNFYCSMTGRVIQVEPAALLIDIPLIDGDQKVWFFKDQVIEIDENKYL